MSNIDILSGVVWIIAICLVIIVAVRFRWFVREMWDAWNYSPSREVMKGWEKAQLEHVGEPGSPNHSVRLRQEEVDGYGYAEITNASYVGDGVILFATGAIRKYPKGFQIRAGYDIWEKQPFRRTPSPIRAGVSFHPQARGII